MRARVVVLTLTSYALVAQADDAPRPITIHCDVLCHLGREPAVGEQVVVTIDAPGKGASLIKGKTKCASPCRIAWPGASHLVVSFAGNLASIEILPSIASLPNVDFDLPLPAPGVGDLKVLADAASWRFGETIERNGLVGGGEVKPVPTLPDDRRPPPSHAQPPPPGPPVPAPPPPAGTPAGPTSPPDDKLVRGVPVPEATTDAEEQVLLDKFLVDVVLVRSSTIGCSGIAVGARHVLTARHCGAATDVGVVGTAGHITTFRVVKRVAPPDAHEDVEMLVVDRPLGLPVRARASSVTAGSTTGVARLVGFGINNFVALTGFGIKREALTSVSDWQCDEVRARTTGCTPQEITFGAGGVDTCLGDSGGPVLDRVDGRWRLVAVASRGVPGPGPVCGRGGIYTHVGAIETWLEQEIGRNK